MSSKLVELMTYTSEYYAYYDETTGCILSITNEIHPIHTTALVIPYESFEKFVSGQVKFSDYYIGYAETFDKKMELTMLSVTDTGYSFKANHFAWISDIPTNDTELTVTWDKTNKKWSFSASEIGKKRLISVLAPPSIKFCVVLADDFDFLIRIIEISSLELSLHTIDHQFTSKLEDNIKNIAISSKVFFDSYGLTTNE